MTESNGVAIKDVPPNVQKETLQKASGLLNNAIGLGRQLSGSELDLVWNAYQIRSNLLKNLHDPRRDIESETGQPLTGELVAERFRDYFDRHPIAARVVELLPEESWSTSPKVFESEEEDNETEFEKAWDELPMMLRTNGGMGRSWYKDEMGSPVWEALKRLDIYSGIGHYGVMLIGLNDGESDLSKPVLGVSPRGVLQPVKRTNRKITYLRVFDETLAAVGAYETNPKSPRYGYPVNYQLTFNDPNDNLTGIGVPTTSTTVHWSRVLHVADNIGTSDIAGVPRMRPVYNALHGLQKIYSGDPEMYWRGAFPGYSIEMDPRFSGNAQLDMSDIQDEAEKYFNTLQRYLISGGMTVKSLAPQVADPMTHIETQIDAICIKLGVPKRIFMGSERGELASSQDAAAWGRRMKQRCNQYITPRIIIPFIDRLIMLGVLPEPEHYSVQWQEEDHQNPVEKTQILAQRTEAMAKYVGGQVDTLMPPLEYLTKEMGYETEEAQEILDAAIEQINKANPEAEDVDVAGRNPKPPALEMEMGPDGKPLPPKPGDDDDKPGQPPGFGAKPKPKPGAPTGNEGENWPGSAVGPLYDLIYNTALKKGANCGIGPGGFLPGNTCAKGGGQHLGGFPESAEGLIQIASVGGGSGANATLVQDPKTGKRFIRKQGNKAALENEVEADKAYAALGVLVPRSKIVTDSNGNSVKLAEYIEGGQTLNQWRKDKSPEQIDAMHAKVAKGFVADALLANWDVAGATGDGDNILVDKAGQVWRIDNGGALAMHGAGNPKGSKFANTVGELGTLKNPSINPPAAKIFKNVTEEQVAAQAKEVLSKKQKVLDAIDNPVTKAKLTSRMQDLENKLPVTVDKTTKASEDFFNPPKVTAFDISKALADDKAAIAKKAASDSGPKLAKGTSPQKKKQTNPKPTKEQLKLDESTSGGKLAKAAGDLTKKEGAKLSANQLKKLEKLNPDGVQGGEIKVPWMNKKQTEALQKAFPGHTFKKNYASVAELGIVKAGASTPQAVASPSKPKTAPKLATKTQTLSSLPSGDYKVLSKSANSLPATFSSTGKAVSAAERKEKLAKVGHVRAWEKANSVQENQALGSWFGSSKWARIPLDQAKGDVSKIDVLVGKKLPGFTTSKKDAYYKNSDVFHKEDAARVKALISGTEKAPKFQGTVFRGMHDTTTAMKKVLAAMDEVGEGGTWTETSPSSSSRSSTFATNWSGGQVLFAVHSKTARLVEHHSSAVGIGGKRSYSPGSGEYEAIMMPGVKYKIRSIKKNFKVGGTTVKHFYELEEL